MTERGKCLQGKALCEVLPLILGYKKEKPSFYLQAYSALNREKPKHTLAHLISITMKG